jgi:hypothetical protein
MGILSTILGGGINVGGSGGSAGPAYSGGGSVSNSGDIVFSGATMNAGPSPGGNTWLGIGMVMAAIAAGYIFGKQ